MTYEYGLKLWIDSDQKFGYGTLWAAAPIIFPKTDSTGLAMELYTFYTS